MPKFKKGMLSSGRTYHSPDGALPVTPQRLKHWANTFAKFRAAGLDCPIHWDHPDDVEKSQPVKRGSSGKRRSAKDVVGYLDDFRVAADGKSAELIVDVRRAEDAEKVRANVARLSPVIFDNWTDGDGKVWQDCIGSVDLVKHPVDHRQTDFVEVPEDVACSLRVVRLGTADEPPSVTMYRLQAEDDDMADENDNEGAAGDTIGNDGGRLKKVMEALAGMDIILSDDTNEENFLEHLEQALLTAAAMEGMGGGNGGAGSEEELAMSTPAAAGFSLDGLAAKQQKYLDNQHRMSLSDRLTKLLREGRCTPAEHKEKAKLLPAVRLSLDNNGNVKPTILESWVASREAIPEGTFWDSQTRTRMSRLEVQPHPADMEEHEVSPERADEIADEMFGRR